MQKKNKEKKTNGKNYSTRVNKKMQSGIIVEIDNDIVISRLLNPEWDDSLTLNNKKYKNTINKQSKKH